VGGLDWQEEMKEGLVRPGDVFCTANPMWLGRAINFVQKAYASDNEAKYSHAGIIVSKDFKTFESLWRIRESNLKEYQDKQILIGRHERMRSDLFLKTYPDFKSSYDQKMYPFWRLFYHMFPPMAKWFSTGKDMVCSELVFRFLVECGLCKYWKAKNPDHLADVIRNYKGWQIVFEGAWL
jgi:hypothetical protein